MRQISLQFNEIVYQLQNIDENMQTASVNERNPQISSVIAKMFSMKSAYDQVFNNLGKQLNKAHQKQIQSELTRSQLNTSPNRNNELAEQSMYNKVVKDNALPSRDPIFLPGEGTGGSTSLCKHCQGAG